MTATAMRGTRERLGHDARPSSRSGRELLHQPAGQERARRAVPEDGEIIAGSGGGDEEQRPVPLAFALVAFGIGVAVPVDELAWYQAVGDPGDDDALVLQALEPVHGADVYPAGVPRVVRADLHNRQSVCFQAGRDLLGEFARRYADRYRTVGGIAPGLELFGDEVPFLAPR